MWVQPEPLSGLQPLDFYILKWRQEEEAQESQFSWRSWEVGETSQHGNSSNTDFFRPDPVPDPVPWGSGRKALAPGSRAGGRLAATPVPLNARPGQ